ncbi:9358_t:CDS:10 [Ambispora gerdemannii]|uniref:9358_t:CDS:1 n=1 Tax=Ambispora gerdemannii TaxID=144530 RepID=A0A9N9AZJ7_9GLOM|nr:9358_t:CDS:10 [Ambispora gerdemannii]
MNRQQANTTTNTPRPPVNNYARAAAQQKPKIVQQSQLQQTQPQRQTQHPTQNINTQQQASAAAGPLLNHGSSLNGKSMPTTKSQPQQQQQQNLNNAVQFSTGSHFSNTNASPTTPTSIQFGSINQPSSSSAVPISPTTPSSASNSGGKVPTQFQKNNNNMTMAFGQVELAHNSTQPSSNQTQISTPAVVSPVVSGPGRPTRFNEIPRTHSAPPQTNNNDSNQNKTNNHQIQQTQAVGHTQPVVHQQPAHTTGPTVLNNAHQININSHQQQLSSITTNHTSSITTNNPLANTTAHNITPTRQIHTGHELPHHRKDSVSSNVSSNDGQSQQSTHHPSHQHPSPHHPNHNTQHNHGGHFQHHPHPQRHNPHPKQTGGMGHGPTVGPGMSNQYNNPRPPRDKNAPSAHISPSPHMNPPQTNVPNPTPMAMPPQLSSIPLQHSHQMWPQYRNSSDQYPIQQFYDSYYSPVYPIPYPVTTPRVPIPTSPHVNNSAQIVPPAKNKAIPIINPLSLKENPLPQKSSLPKKDETPPPAVTIEPKQSAETIVDKDKQLTETKESKAVKIVHPAEKEKEERERKEKEEQERRDREEKERREREERERKEREEKERKEREERHKRELREREERERIEREEKVKKEREEKERKEREDQERKEREEKERKEREERLRKEREEKEREEQLRKEKEEKERKEREERERKERDERIKKEQEEKERKEREERERKEREEAEKIKREQEEKERKEREERERKEREETERIKKEQEEKERQAKEEKVRFDLEQKKKEEEEAVATAAKAGRPGPLDLSRATSTPALGSAPLSALGSARIIDDLNNITYPPNIKSPNPQLNANAEPGKFKYDRSFLMQFMDVCKDKPDNLPALDAIGMEESKEDKKRTQQRNMGGSSGSGSGVGNSRTPPHKSVGTSQYTNMGEFKSPPKTSDERFQQSTTNLIMSRPSSSSFGRAPLGNRPGSNNPLLPPNAMLSNNNPPSPGRTPSGRGGGRDRQSRGKSQHSQPGAPTIPPDQVVPLKQSENRWQPPTIAGGLPNSTEDFIPLEVVQRKVKALLNKLTLEKFDRISDQIIDYANKSRTEKDGRILRTVIQLTFLKACDESNFSQMYAQLCRKMMERIDPEIVDENVKSPDGNKYVQGGTLFRKYLLNRCQEDFEKGWKVNIPVPNDANGEPDLLSDEYYAAVKAKRIGLGLIKFIGELFKLTMLTERIMHECIKKLLSNVSNPEEEETESLCKLLTTVGKQLDHPKAKDHMDAYFTRMKTMSDNPNLSSRIKFMILDVIDLRNNNWVPRRDNNAPKTIAEIHEDAAKQKEEAEFLRRTASSGGLPRLDQQLSRVGSGRRDPRDKGTHGGNVPPSNADGWSTVGSSSSASRKTGDLSKFGSVSRSKVSAGLSLAPGGQGSFAGLAGGSKGWKSDNRDRDDKPSVANRTSPVPPTTSSTNSFSILAHTESTEGRKSMDGASTNAEAVKSMASTSTPPQERRKLNLLPKGSTPGNVPIKSTDTLTKDTTSTSAEKPAETPSLADQASKKIKNMIEEYWSVLDIKEVIACMKELPPQYLAEAFLSFITGVIEKKQKDVNNVAEVFKELTSKAIIGKADVKKAFEDALPIVDDLELDVPQVSEFTGQLLHSAGLEIDETAELVSTMNLSNMESSAAKTMLAYLDALKSEIGETAFENKLYDSSFTLKTISLNATPDQINKVLDKRGLSKIRNIINK